MQRCSPSHTQSILGPNASNCRYTNAPDVPVVWYAALTPYDLKCLRGYASQPYMIVVLFCIAVIIWPKPKSSSRLANCSFRMRRCRFLFLGIWRSNILKSEKAVTNIVQKSGLRVPAHHCSNGCPAYASWPLKPIDSYPPFDGTGSGKGKAAACRQLLVILNWGVGHPTRSSYYFSRKRT